MVEAIQGSMIGIGDLELRAVVITDGHTVTVLGDTPMAHGLRRKAERVECAGDAASTLRRMTRGLMYYRLTSMRFDSIHEAETVIGPSWFPENLEPVPIIDRAGGHS